MEWVDRAKKSHWILEAAVPADHVQDTARRALVDLPDDVTPGARQVAMLTTHRLAQTQLLGPIVEALKVLEALPAQDWEGGFLVADGERFNWRTAPFRHYASFEDFYQRELAETWGKWTDLQETYRLRQKGDIDDKGVEQRLGKQGRPKTGEEKPTDGRFKYGGNPTYLEARIKRDRPDIIERLEAGEFRSVRAAAKEAGIVREPTPLDRLKRAWSKLSDEDQAAFLEHANIARSGRKPGKSRRS